MTSRRFTLRTRDEEMGGSDIEDAWQTYLREIRRYTVLRRWAHVGIGLIGLLLLGWIVCSSLSHRP